MQYYLSALKKYATFSGRASRAECWYFVLDNFVIGVCLVFITVFLSVVFQSDTPTLLVTFYQLFMIIPHTSLGIRRMHDINKSGWYFFIPLYNIILLCTEGTKGDNNYGPDSKTSEAK